MRYNWICPPLLVSFILHRLVGGGGTFDHLKDDHLKDDTGSLYDENRSTNKKAPLFDKDGIDDTNHNTDDNDPHRHGRRQLKKLEDCREAGKTTGEFEVN